ncbi:MAG: GTPase HflX [Promethearchaeota archaeon]
MDPGPEAGRAVLLELKSDLVEQYDPKEAQGLVGAAGYSLVAVETQARKKPHARYFFGPGKVEELKERYATAGDEDITFIFNNRLAASQISNLSTQLERKVVDRDLLILEIFERHAVTREAKLQVELARMSITKTEMRSRISRETKSERPGRDYHGTGYDLYSRKKRHYTRRERTLRERIGKFRVQRANRRRGRKIPQISIVGYTNSGKTSLLNQLSGSNLPTMDEVFTTLTTATRRVQVPERVRDDGFYRFVQHPFLLTDTVGFISDLPHELLDAFVSTLEEVKFSDGVLLVHDISEPGAVITAKHRTCLEILHQIGVFERGIPVVDVLNKSDLVDEAEAREKAGLFPNCVVVSALTRENFPRLRATLLQAFVGKSRAGRRPLVGGQNRSWNGSAGRPS